MLPIESSIIGLLCSVCWFSYSILDGYNLNIMIPNALGMNLIIL